MFIQYKDKYELPVNVICSIVNEKLTQAVLFTATYSLCIQTTNKP